MPSDNLKSIPVIKSQRARPFHGLAAGALAGTGASVIASLIDTFAFQDESASTLISPLIPLVALLFTSFVFLPIIWFALKIAPKKIALFLPPIAIAACCAIYVVFFPGSQTRLGLLAISTFSFVLLPLLSASIVAAWVWIHPEPNRIHVV